MESENPSEIDQLLDQTQRLAGIGALTLGVAHELNNPLSVITTTCNDLLTRAKAEGLSDEMLFHHLKMIEQSAWRCAQLVHKLRTYSHLDSSQLTETNLNQIIDEGLSLVAYQFRSQFNVEIETSLAEGLPPVRWEPNRITQVLINLLANARDALRPDGGTIYVRSWALFTEDAVAFSIRDSGPGIPGEIEDKIFQPFFTTKPAGQGTGLGLSIASRIIDEHGGELAATNHPDGGALFTVVLPRYPEDGRLPEGGKWADPTLTPDP